MRVAVFGATGFLGRNLAAHLRISGHTVDCYSSSDGKSIDSRSGLLKPSFEFHRDVDAVFYLPQSPFYREPTSHFTHVMNVNALTAFECANKAHRAGVKKFVYASSGNVYAQSFDARNERSPLRRDDLYAFSKIYAEELLSSIDSDMDVCSPRFFGIFGRDQERMLLSNLKSRIESKQPIYLEAADCDSNDPMGLRVSYLDVDTTVQALDDLVSLPKMPDAINIAGPEAISIRDAATALAEVLKARPQFEVSPKNRQFDLIADITLFKKLLNPKFVNFQDTLKLYFKEEI